MESIVASDAFISFVGGAFGAIIQIAVVFIADLFADVVA